MSDPSVTTNPQLKSGLKSKCTTTTQCLQSRGEEGVLLQSILFVVCVGSGSDFGVAQSLSWFVLYPKAEPSSGFAQGGLEEVGLTPPCPESHVWSSWAPLLIGTQVHFYSVPLSTLPSSFLSACPTVPSTNPSLSCCGSALNSHWNLSLPFPHASFPPLPLLPVIYVPPAPLHWHRWDFTSKQSSTVYHFPLISRLSPRVTQPRGTQVIPPAPSHGIPPHACLWEIPTFWMSVCALGDWRICLQCAKM